MRVFPHAPPSSRFFQCDATDTETTYVGVEPSMLLALSRARDTAGPHGVVRLTA